MRPVCLHAPAAGSALLIDISGGGPSSLLIRGTRASLGADEAGGEHARKWTNVACTIGRALCLFTSFVCIALLLHTANTSLTWGTEGIRIRPGGWVQEADKTLAKQRAEAHRGFFGIG